MITLPITCNQLVYILMTLPPIGLAIGLWIGNPVLTGISLGFLIADGIFLAVLMTEQGWTFPIRCKCDKK